MTTIYIAFGTGDGKLRRRGVVFRSAFCLFIIQIFGMSHNSSRNSQYHTNPLSFYCDMNLGMTASCDGHYSVPPATADQQINLPTYRIVSQQSNSGQGRKLETGGPLPPMSRDVEPKQTRRSLGTRPAKGGTPKTKARCPSQTTSETEQPQKGTGFLLHGKRSRTFYSKACCLAWQVQTAHLSSADFFRFRAGPTTPALAHIFSHLLPSLSSSECIGSRFTSPFYHPLTATPHGQSPMPI